MRTVLRRVARRMVASTMPRTRPKSRRQPPSWHLSRRPGSSYRAAERDLLRSDRFHRGLERILDPGLDACAYLDGAAHCAEAIVRFGDHVRQYLPRAGAAVGVGKGDAKPLHDVGETVAELVAYLFGLDDHLERLRLSATRRQRIDVHRRASTQRGAEP